jgi:ElaB/YqjD/DUF883 family membrane-anchored ribosome-binding protein
MMANPNTAQRNQSGFGQAATEVKSSAQELVEKAKESASTVADRTKDLASSAAQSAGDAAANLGQRAKDTATNLGHRADDVVGSAGTAMKNLGSTVREKAPHEGVLGAASSGVAGALEKGGRIIEEEKLSGLASDFTEMLRERPILTLCIGVGIGFMLAQLMPSGRRS